MKKSNCAMLIVTAITTVLTACGKPVDVAVESSAKETTYMSVEASENETTIAVSEMFDETELTTQADIISGDWVTHTVGVISVDLPEYYLSDEISQMAEGIDIRMLMCCDPEQQKFISIAYYDIRACLKSHSHRLHVPSRPGIFGPNSLNVARYAAFIWTKSPTKWNAQPTETMKIS